MTSTDEPQKKTPTRSEIKMLRMTMAIDRVMESYFIWRKRHATGNNFVYTPSPKQEGPCQQ